MILLVSAVASPAEIVAHVALDASTPLATIPPLALGVNTAVWDGHLLDPAVPRLLKPSVTALRFPGGSTTDVYHWQANTASQGQYVNPRNTFDAFMGVVSRCGAQAIICVNYGTNLAGDAGGDPLEAAAWVDYANHTKNYGIVYWEIGNEVYGNGEYQATFETDLHRDHSPTEYGRNVRRYVRAMKAKDPTIKIGAVLAAPDHFPDGKDPDWNTHVLAECGSAIDFVIVHWYPQEPGHENDRFLLNTPATQIAGMMAKLRTLTDDFCGKRDSPVPIFVTETNSVSSKPGKQAVSLVNALFLADDCVTWLEQGAANVDVWALHNGLGHGNTSAALHGTAAFGDYGILSNGSSPEPPAETPFPAYYGMLMASIGAAGDRFVSVASDQPLLSVHAARRAGGDLTLLLINKDPANPCAATVSIRGFTPAPAATDRFYGQTSGGGDITSAASTVGSTFTRTLPPYSLTSIEMRPEVPSAATPPSP